MGERQRTVAPRAQAVAILAITFGLAGCHDGHHQYVAGVYTGNTSSGPMMMVVGDEAITRLQLTIRTSSGGSSTTSNIDTTDFWPITWDEEGYCYTFEISLPVADTTALIKGCVTTDIDEVPFIQGSVKVGTSTGSIFNLYLQK
jgi:hypothetical protein